MELHRSADANPITVRDLYDATDSMVSNDGALMVEDPVTGSLFPIRHAVVEDNRTILRADGVELGSTEDLAAKLRAETDQVVAHLAVKFADLDQEDGEMATLQMLNRILPADDPEARVRMVRYLWHRYVRPEMVIEGGA